MICNSQYKIWSINWG